MKRYLLLLLLLAGCASVAYEEHTDAGSKYVLDNGLTIILKENPDTGMVALDYMVKKSIATDGELNGLGYFTTRMLLAGTTSRTKEQIVKEIESVGGSIQARTYAEYAEIVIDVPSNHLSVALDVLQDVILNPTFPAEEVEKERITLLGELQSKLDQPGIVAEELFMKTLYEGHPYQHPIDGYPETVQQISRDDLINHYRTWYVSNKAVLAVVGNIKERPTLFALRKLFAGLQSRDALYETPGELPPVFGEKTESKNMPIESFYIQHGYQLIPASHPDFIKLRMANAVLGSGSGSRLFYELRDKRALAYSVSSLAPSTRTTGFMKISMISRPAVLNESLAGIEEQIERIKLEKVPEEELQLVKQKVRGFFFLDHQKTTDQANYLALYEMQGYGYHYDVEYPDRIANVSSDEVLYVANKYFHNPSVAVVGPFEEGVIE